MGIVVDPPQPVGQGEYPLSAITPSSIDVFVSSEDYQNKTGGPPPAFNTNMPPKFWRDKSVKDSDVIKTFTYNTVHLDPSGQVAVVTPISLPGFAAGAVNIPPDSGAGSNPGGAIILVPSRTLLPNEIVWPSEGGVINVYNTSIYDPRNAGGGSSSSSGGGYTADDRAIDRNTNQLVAAIAAKVLVA